MSGSFLPAVLFKLGVGIPIIAEPHNASRMNVVFCMHEYVVFCMPGYCKACFYSSTVSPVAQW